MHHPRASPDIRLGSKAAEGKAEFISALARNGHLQRSRILPTDWCSESAPSGCRGDAKTRPLRSCNVLCIVGGIEIEQISQCLVASYWNLCIWRRVPPSPPSRILGMQGFPASLQAFWILKSVRTAPRAASAFNLAGISIASHDITATIVVSTDG